MAPRRACCLLGFAVVLGVGLGLFAVVFVFHAIWLSLSQLIRCLIMVILDNDCHYRDDARSIGAKKNAVFCIFGCLLIFSLFNCPILSIWRLLPCRAASFAIPQKYR